MTSLENKGILWQPELDRVFVSSGFHCPLGCAYCYIYQEGFERKDPEANEITGKELVRLLTKDARFRKGRRGTIIALGCISDPFHPRLLHKTMEFLGELSKIENPIQFSTKFPIPKSMIDDIAKMPNQIYPFISICTLRNWKKLEPNTPFPNVRIETLRTLIDAGLYATLLYKPLMPGINDDEYQSMIDIAVKCGAKSFVVGTLYFNNLILETLANTGLNTTKLCRLPIEKDHKVNWLKSELFYLNLHSVQESIIMKARSHGLKPFKSTICVPISNMKLVCHYKLLHPDFCVNKTCKSRNLTMWCEQ